MTADSDSKDLCGQTLLNELMEKAGVKTDDQGNLTIVDALKLKHSINRDIRYCGLNAQEVEQKKEITSEEWVAVRKWYAELVKMYGYRVWPFWYVVAAALALFYFSYTVQPWRLGFGIACLLAIIWITAKLGEANGYREGFFAGYENGHERGISKLLGLDDEESRDIHDRAIEMEIDEGVLSRRDQEKASGSLTPPRT